MGIEWLAKYLNQEWDYVNTIISGQVNEAEKKIAKIDKIKDKLLKIIVTHENNNFKRGFLTYKNIKRCTVEQPAEQTAYELADYLYTKYKKNEKKDGLTLLEIETLNKFWIKPKRKI